MDYSVYGWIIDSEKVTTAFDHKRYRETKGLEGLPTRKGWTGPSDISPSVEARLKTGEGRKFRMYDDDGNLYYSGRYIGPEDDENDFAFGPLNDLGTPDAGACRIDYQGDTGRWATL